MLSSMTPLDFIWIVIAVVWLTGGLLSKRSVKRAPAGFTLLHSAALICAGLLIFSRWFENTPLAIRIVPATPAFYYSGLVLAALGAAFAIWARLLLGRNWSGFVVVKQDHELIRSGPYAIVRHPIYSGFLLVILGAAIVEGEFRAFLGLAIVLIAWHTKARREEQLMIGQFGEQYEDYRRRVKALIPYVL